MSFANLIADALAMNQPIVLVGDPTATMEHLTLVAGSAGMAIARIDAQDVPTLPAAKLPPRGSRDPWLVIVEGCEQVLIDPLGSTDGMALDDIILDLAFDGDPSLPSDCTLVLSFAQPTPLSDALADEAVPCTVLSIDMAGEPSIAQRVAAELGLPLIDVPLSKVEPGDLRGLPQAA